MTRKDKTPDTRVEAADTAGGDQLRQSVRLKTRETARLSFSTDQPFLCEIQDFSEQGLQLVGLDQGADNTPSSRATRVEIEFPLNEHGVGQHRLQGALVRSSDSGLGLKLDSMTDEAYQALVQARGNIKDANAAGLGPDEHQAIVRDCIHLFHVFLDKAWRDFLDGIALKVAERDTATLNLPDHSRYLAGLAHLLNHGQEIGRALYAGVVRQMHRMAEPKKDLELQPSEPSALSIVDEYRFEDWLNIAHVYNRIEGDNRVAMFEFALCFSRLTPVPIERHNDPFGPESVCLAFQDSISRLDLNNEMKGLIYRAFGEAITPRYPALYAQLNKLLVPLQPPKSERPRPELTPGTTTPVKPKQATPEDISAQIGKLADIAEKLFALTPGTRPPESAVKATPIQIAESAPALSIAEHETLKTLAQTLSRLATRQPASQAGEAGQTPALSEAPALDELLGAAPAGPTLTRRVTALLDRADASARLNTRQRDSLGMAASLMNQALAEHGERSDLDGLLKKLEKPLYELVLQGEDPLNQADHPLRRLLNLVDRFAIVADDSGKFTDRELGDLLATVINHAVATKDGFGQACDALEKLLKFPSQYHRQRISNHLEMFEAQEAIRIAKLATARLLDQRLAGRAVPRIALTLLDQGLRQHLVLQSLRGNSQEGLATLQLIDALLETDWWPLADSSWLHEIEVRLRGSNPARHLIDACMADLASFLARPDADGDVSLPADWFLNETGLGRAEDTDAAPGDLPGRLGEWWDIDLDARAVPMQLIWLSQPPGSFGFVNRAATRKLQLTRADLAKRQAEGSLRRGEDRDLPLLERSENGTVDNLYQRLAYRAHHDPLTGLLNLKGFMFTATRQPHRSGKGHVVSMLEFMPYRAILDTCGIEAGERLTRELAAIAQRQIGSTGALATIGDGRLALLLADFDVPGARKVADSLVKALRGFQFRHGEALYLLDIRIGLAGLAPGDSDLARAMRHATTACTAAGQGLEPVQAYEDAGSQLQEQKSLHTWGQRLDSLLTGDGLFLRCQQVTPLWQDATEPPYYEVLLGVRDESGQIVSPQPFVEAAEYWKRSHDLDLWVIEQTFAWIRSNPAAFAATGGFSINLSGLSMSDTGILATLHRHLTQGDIETGKIIFEITETATVNNYDAAREFIEQIRRYGCRFCIDDFGSGNASYGYLRNLRTDTLKIDGAFVKDMVNDPDLLAMVKSMNDIGHSLGMKTVAEYVASPEILSLVREIGVDYGQGYELAKPIHIDELARL